MAHLLLAPAAGAASAAVDIGIYGDQLANFQAGNTITDFYDSTREFMAQDHRRLYLCGAFSAVENMNVRPADAAGRNLYQDLPLPRLRQGKRAGLDPLISKKIGSYHICLLLIFSAY